MTLSCKFRLGDALYVLLAVCSQAPPTALSSLDEGQYAAILVLQQALSCSMHSSLTSLCLPAMIST